MASAKQACQAIDDVLMLPPNTASGFAARIRAQGIISSTQGKPEHIASVDIAAILLAVVTSSAVVADYLDMRPFAGGPTFGETLACFIDEPKHMVELRIDAAVPGAVLTYRGTDSGIRTASFEVDEPRHRPAFTREVRIGSDVFIRLATALASMPEVRAGRPPLRERYRRMEHAVAYQ